MFSEKELQLERLDKAKKKTNKANRIGRATLILQALLFVWFSFNIYHHYQYDDSGLLVFYSALWLINIPAIYFNIRTIKNSEVTREDINRLIKIWENRDD